MNTAINNHLQDGKENTNNGNEGKKTVIVVILQVSEKPYEIEAV